jgi:hypothetical protein
MKQDKNMLHMQHSSFVPRRERRQTASAASVAFTIWSGRAFLHRNEVLYSSAGALRVGSYGPGGSVAAEPTSPEGEVPGSWLVGRHAHAADRSPRSRELELQSGRGWLVCVVTVVRSSSVWLAATSAVGRRVLKSGAASCTAGGG